MNSLKPPPSLYLTSAPAHNFHRCLLFPLRHPPPPSPLATLAPQRTLPVLSSSVSSSGQSYLGVCPSISYSPIHPSADPRLNPAFLIALVWGSCKWKGGFGTSKGPLPAPKPSVDTIEMARIRGAPVFGRHPATQASGIPNPPPPAYINPPRYDDVRLQCDEGTHSC